MGMGCSEPSLLPSHVLVRLRACVSTVVTQACVRARGACGSLSWPGVLTAPDSFITDAPQIPVPKSREVV